MFKVYSKRCEYALRLLCEIPSNSMDKKFLAKDLIKKAKVPLPSARKALQMLVEADILDAVPGPNGGYRFSKDPGRLTLMNIIEAIDGKSAFDACVMGLPQCDLQNPCLIHHSWMKIKDRLLAEMKKKTLGQLMKHDKMVRV